VVTYVTAEHTDGYKGKFTRMAEFMVEKGVGAVVRTSNPFRKVTPYRATDVDNLRAVIEKTLADAENICGRADPSIYLIGHFTATVTVAAVAHEFDQVTKILLVAPMYYPDITHHAIVREGLPKYTGELYIVKGSEDKIKGDPAYICDLAVKAAKKEFVIVPNCDREFRHARNGKILSKAPLWAFLGDDTFPNPKDGIELVTSSR